MTSKFLTTVKRRLPTSGEPWQPHNYQKKALRFLLEHAAAALFLDPGLGKTSITYAAILFLLKRGAALGFLVVGPLRPIVSTWPAEQKKWTDFQGLDVVLLHGPNKEKLAAEKHDVYLINYEGLDWLINSGTLRKMLRAKLLDSLVFDELSKMKNSDSVRYKLISKWLGRFVRRWGLTGSPAANGLLDLFGQCYVLDMGRAFGQYITRFRAQFFVPAGMFDFTPAPGAKDAIYERLKPLALRMAAEDYLELPQRNVVPIYYELPKAVRPQYEQLEDEFYTLIAGEDVFAANAAVAGGKLRQFASGAIYKVELDELTGAPKRRKSDEYVEIHTAKVETFLDLLDELQGQQVLVTYEYKHDLDRIRKALKKKELPYIGSGVSIKRSRELEAQWNAGTLPVLYGHPASMSMGLNLQGSDAYNIICFTIPWDFEQFDQVVARLLRQGNKSKVVNVYMLTGRQTKDEDVALALRSKEATQDALFAALKNRRQRPTDYDPQANAVAHQLLAAAMRKKRAKTKL